MTGLTRTELVRIKVKRAKHHIEYFNRRIDDFFRGPPNPYPVMREDDPKTGDLIFKLGECLPISEDFPAIIGDILQNLRTALDHLAWQLVLANGKTPTSQTAFPIAENPEKFEAMLGRKVEGMSTNAINKIRALHPYGGANEDLWGLHQLNNTDKHRLLFVVGAAHTGVEVDVTKLFSGINIRTVQFMLKPADYAWPLKNGKELYRILKETRKAHVDENPNFVVQIAFGDAEVMEGEPIFPPLHQLADFIDSIVLSFDADLA
jgi:hypothetical protein